MVQIQDEIDYPLPESVTTNYSFDTEDIWDLREENIDLREKLKKARKKAKRWKRKALKLRELVRLKYEIEMD